MQALDIYMCLFCRQSPEKNTCSTSILAFFKPCDVLLVPVSGLSIQKPDVPQVFSSLLDSFYLSLSPLFTVGTRLGVLRIIHGYEDIWRQNAISSLKYFCFVFALLKRDL